MQNSLSNDFACVSGEWGGVVLLKERKEEDLMYETHSSLVGCVKVLEAVD